MNTLVAILAEHFADWGWTWKIGGEYRVPDEEDLHVALDRAAAMLYAEPVGTKLEVGRLIIIKTTTGHDVYVLAGSYE